MPGAPVYSLAVLNALVAVLILAEDQGRVSVVPVKQQERAQMPEPAWGRFNTARRA
jgi:hypothetical protein